MDFNLNSLQLGKAFNLMTRTMPILLIKMGAYVLFWVAALIYLAITFGVSALVGQAVPLLGTILFIVALVSIVPIYNLVYQYVFFMLKAAHIAIIGELLVNNKLPDGINQLQYGQQRVRERFGEVNAMFLVDELVSGVIRAFTRTVYNVTSWLPGDTLQQLVTVLNRIVYYATTYIDEAILARSFTREKTPVWVNARDGVILYAMVWKPLLVNAIALMILSYVPFIVGFLIFALPVGLLINIVSSSLAGWSVIFTLILAYLIKIAVGDAFAMAAMIATYYQETRDLKPDPQMVATLNNVSDKFQEIMGRAKEEIAQFRAEKQAGAKDDAPVNAAQPATSTPPAGTRTGTATPPQPEM